MIYGGLVASGASPVVTRPRAARLARENVIVIATRLSLRRPTDARVSLGAPAVEAAAAVQLGYGVDTADPVAGANIASSRAGARLTGVTFAVSRERGFID